MGLGLCSFIFSLWSTFHFKVPILFNEEFDLKSGRQWNLAHCSNLITTNVALVSICREHWSRMGYIIHGDKNDHISLNLVCLRLSLKKATIFDWALTSITYNKILEREHFNSFFLICLFVLYPLSKFQKYFPTYDPLWFFLYPQIFRRVQNMT